MVLVHALVFFISISTGPAHPGPNKYGSHVSWVLYAAPSEQKAREWAQAKYDRMHEQDDVPQTIKEFLVLPLNDTLYTEDGPKEAQWTLLPGLEKRQIVGPGGRISYDSALEEEFHDSVYVMPPNRHMKDPYAGMTPEQIRDSLRTNIDDGAQRNWHENNAWYYVVHTKQQVMLVKAVNSFVASVVYAKVVRGTPAGDAVACVEAWQGLNKYSEQDHCL